MNSNNPKHNYYCTLFLNVRLKLFLSLLDPKHRCGNFLCSNLFETDVNNGLAADVVNMSSLHQEKNSNDFEAIARIIFEKIIKIPRAFGDILFGLVDNLTGKCFNKINSRIQYNFLRYI